MYTLPKGLSIFQMFASIPSESAIYLEGWCPLKLGVLLKPDYNIISFFRLLSQNFSYFPRFRSYHGPVCRVFAIFSIIVFVLYSRLNSIRDPFHKMLRMECIFMYFVFLNFKLHGQFTQNYLSCKLHFSAVYIIFLVSAGDMDCGYS